MTRADIIRMAREAAQENFTADTGHWFKMEVKDLERFAAIVAAAEREACAKLCDAIEQDFWSLYKGRPPYTGAELGRADPHTQGTSGGALLCSEAIRERVAK